MTAFGQDPREPFAQGETLAHDLKIGKVHDHLIIEAREMGDDRALIHMGKGRPGVSLIGLPEFNFQRPKQRLDDFPRAENLPPLGIGPALDRPSRFHNPQIRHRIAAPHPPVLTPARLNHPAQSVA